MDKRDSEEQKAADVESQDMPSQPGFSLLVSADGTAWETDGALRFPKVRFGEFTESSGADINIEEPDTLRRLNGTEAFLAYEQGAGDELVRFGTLHGIEVGSTYITFRFEQTRTLHFDALHEYASRLGIEEFEFMRTHWAVKNGPVPSQLRDLISSPPPGVQAAAIDRLIRTLVDGSEEQRADVLLQVQVSMTLDRAAFARRLWEEIQGRFSARVQAKFEGAIRDPNKFSSIRSWMLSCLVRADAEGFVSGDLILSHLTEDFEPERHVRFWTLAGLFQSGAKFVAKAARRVADDSAPEVALLGRLIEFDASLNGAERSTEWLLQELQTLIGFLAPEGSDKAWPLLRALRVCPIDELIPSVCGFLLASPINESYEYDALYALTPKPVRSAASSILEQRIGLTGIVELVLRLASTANVLALRNFSSILRPFGFAEVREAIETSGLRESYPQAEDLLDLLKVPEPGTSTETYIAGYASDTIDPRIDDLGVSRDAQTLAAVMLAREVKPPLAIGLFGDWGSGKSHFMKAMELATENLKGSSDRFCSEVVSIHFNAWHYADQNLWASLFSYLLEELRGQIVGSREDIQARQDAREITGLQEVIEEAESEVKQVRADARERAVALREAEEARRHTQLRLRDLTGLLPKGSTERRKLDEALKAMGVSAAVDTARDLDAVVRDAHSLGRRAAATASAFLSCCHRPSFWVWAGLSMLVPLVLYVLLENLEEFVRQVGLVVGESAAVGATFLAMARKALSTVRDGLEAIDEAKATFDKKLEASRADQSEQEKSLRMELASLTAQEEEARARLESASSRIAELEERRREAEEGRSLAHFLVERSDSDDYSQHLGLVSTIRADLESLAKRLDAGIGSDKRRIERIVLYIDDLDRCSSKQVRAVLEAVHLLLAYPLFVVVVGVDPRWLQYALHEEFPAFRKDTEAKVAIGRPTPQNYLEKIFQIPFSLRPMSETGFEKLVTRLMGTTGSERATGSAGSGSQERSPSDSGPVDGGNDAGPRPGHGIEDPPPKGPDGDKGEPKSGVPILETRGEPTPPEFRIHDAAMVIQPWETAFAVRLYGLVPTPRALKRFTNLYRILKAPIPQADLPGFEGTEQLPGEFQVPMLLLALQIGLPGGQILRDLYADAQEGRDVLIALKEMDGPAADTEKVREVTQNTPLPGDPALYLKWIPRVARFSFNLSSSLSLPARV